MIIEKKLVGVDYEGDIMYITIRVVDMSEFDENM